MQGLEDITPVLPSLIKDGLLMCRGMPLGNESVASSHKASVATREPSCAYSQHCGLGGMESSKPSCGCCLLGQDVGLDVDFHLGQALLPLPPWCITCSARVRP